MLHRLDALRKLLPPKFDGYLATNDKNMLYLTGFSGGSKLLVPLESEPVLFVNSLNLEAGKNEARNVRIEAVKMGEHLDKKVAEEISQLRMKNVGFDTLTVPAYDRFKENLENSEIGTAEEIMSSLRAVKDKSEIASMKSAGKLTSHGMKTAFEFVKAGVKEREVAAEIEYDMRTLGSDGVAFDTLVSSGTNSAFPHGGCGDRIIRKGDFVVIDVGAKYRSYCSDLTRTLIAGKPSSKQMEVYETVKKSQEMAINQIRAGLAAKDADKIAREFIRQKGFGEQFIHGLGHGVGLDVHEMPVIGPTSTAILVAGNVVTVEPGIYIARFGGVRIEDTVLVQDDKTEKLTDAPYL